MSRAVTDEPGGDGPVRASVRLGRFEVVSRLGVGGMGEVFRARIDGDGREVALKLMQPDYASDKRLRRMFEAEADIGARLHHPNVVEIVEFGAIDDVLFLAMELVDGVALDRILRHGTLEPALAAHVCRELCAGLDYAHHLLGDDGQPLGLVHRDVSAGNVLVSARGQVKLTDFGVVKVRGLSLTRTDEVKGKLAYMAPEQYLGQKIDGRVDVFAVGVLLHKLLHGHGLFRDVHDWLREGTPGPVEGPLHEVLVRALAPDPEARFPSAAAFRDALPMLPDGADQLAAKVAAARARDQPLAALDRLVVAALADGNGPGTAPAGRAAPVTPPTPMNEGVTTPVSPAARARVGTAASAPLDLDRTLDDAEDAFTKTAATPLSAQPTAQKPSPFPFDNDPTRTLSTGIVQRRAIAPIPLAEPPHTRVSLPPAETTQQGRRRDAKRARRIYLGSGLAVAALAIAVPLVLLHHGTRSIAATPLATVDPPSAVPPAPPAAVASPAAETPPAPVEKPPSAVEKPAPPAAAAVEKAAPAPRPVRAGVAHPAQRPHVVRAAAPAEPGMLTLDTNPWATAFLGARKLGDTPFAHVSLPAGKHELSLAVEGKGPRRKVTVVIRPGAETRLSVPLAR